MSRIGVNTSLYGRWKAMINRCDNTDNPDYSNYGGRGINVCPEWYSYERFAADMGEPPEDTQLDRKNNDEGYFKNNCRWVDKETNANNQRTYSTNTTGIPGVSWHRARKKWYVYSKPLRGQQKMLYYGDDFFEACCVRKSYDAKRLT